MYACSHLDARALWRTLSLASVLAICTPVSAYAQSHDGPGKYGTLTGDALFSNDSDHFNEERANIGYLFPNGWGLGASVTHYNAPDWSVYGRGLYGQYRQHDAQQIVDAQLGVMDTGGYATPTGMLDYMRHISGDTSLGVSAERNVVDSISGIEQGLTYNSLMLVLDHQFTPRFTVGAVAGAMWFSDHNTRPMLRTRWNYELVANSGLNSYIKTRNYYDSNPNRGDYYSPRWLAEYSGGLSWRAALSDKAAFFVSADLGRQNTENGGVNIWGARIGLQNHRSRTMQWQVAVETTNNHTAGFAGGGSGYRYTSVTGRFMFPFN
ncbi:MULTISPECIES: hypothetical protein [Paraburkholderia]|uniref:Uncharacterized protein n=1 Tax=Paraburkholderia madseniana TaxID=2599607 RepID=A0AAP5BAU0_9BURK|nr:MULTISPECIES: hypothetical protein [Paraburkholderia]MCX4145192.1 hypothetical protein [Paraburkholderia madseniana]MDN7148142.1 hypothetical protein [Paraburkholderia sp. WS6]MDQ6407022.1 hypothetical protein [Paraburkholderia madseniana]